MRKVYLFSVGFVLLLAAFVAAVEKKEPESNLRATPKVVMVGRPVMLWLSLYGYDACSGVRWHWPRTESYQEADCDPDDPLDYESYRRYLTPMNGGDWEICVSLERSGDTYKRLCVRFYVAGNHFRGGE